MSTRCGPARLQIVAIRRESGESNCSDFGAALAVIAGAAREIHFFARRFD